MKDMLSKKCLKFKSARKTLRVTQIRVVFYVHPLLVNIAVLSMDFPITNCLPFFFQTDETFYQIIFSLTLGKGPSKLLIKKVLEKKVLERTKVYNWFISKGDNFNVNQI